MSGTARRAALVLAMAGAASLFAAAGARAADEIAKSFFGSVAIGGYDPVAYLTENRAVEGKKAISLAHKGANFHFANEANRALFIADPDKYVPAYGGHCANGLANGTVIDGDPEVFRIENGRTYLFYAKDGRAAWEKDPAGLKAKADATWAKERAGR